MRAAIAQAVARWSAQIAAAGVTVDPDVLTGRAALLGLPPPGMRSSNGSCRMIRAEGGWLAVNLPRESDLECVPAWIGCGFEDEPWAAIVEAARTRSADELVEAAQGLGLAVSRVGSVGAGGDLLRRMGAAGPVKPPLVLDLSSLWAGPLCGGILAQAGARVIKAESLTRADASRATPQFFDRLNGAKQHLAFDFAEVRALMEQADVVITSARPRAFEQMGITPAALFAARPSLVWVAVTAYGWDGPHRGRVGFGDDAAAAAGLVDWTPEGPRFLGDAIADPLTGLAAAAGALEALGRGGGFMVDAALATTAAGVVAGRLEAAA